MRQITLTARLGADAEIVHSQQGTSFFKCRVANSEYRDKENETHWFNVISFNPIYVKNYQNFKKGTSVIITGSYSDGLYQTRNQTVEISRDINANSIEFNNNGNSERQQNQTQYQPQMQQPQMRQPQQQMPPINVGNPQPQHFYGNPAPQQQIPQMQQPQMRQPNPQPQMQPMQPMQQPQMRQPQPQMQQPQMPPQQVQMQPTSQGMPNYVKDSEQDDLPF